ncbi:VOC family protein, partial [Chloroflexota bacterium]
MKTNLIDHISIAVRDLDQARKVYENLLGLELDSILVVPKEKIKIARYYV